MEKQIERVLKQCIITVREGTTNINVFDLMYETSLPYPELKVVLDKLIEDKELEAVDIKTYKFIGDINRKFEVAPKQDKLAEKRAELERKRREIIARMQRELEEKLDDNSMLVEDSPDSELGEDGSDMQDSVEKVWSFTSEKWEEVIDFLTVLFYDGYKNDASANVPAHTLWGDEDEFLRHCAELTIELFLRNENCGRNIIIKKAQTKLNYLRKTNNAKSAEAYERVVYELQIMSSYYFNKIKKLCLQG